MVVAHLHTIGHGALDAGVFMERSRRAGVEAIIDVRSVPASRRHPHFARDAMERWLHEARIGYRWEQELGGFRRPLPDSINLGLRHASFRGYADYMATPAFATALARVLVEAATARVAVMCSETLWWRCHRRLIADAAVLLHDVEVLHVDGRGRSEPHRVTPGAAVEDGVVIYR